MDHFTLRKGLHDIRGDKVKDNAGKRGVDILVGVGQVKRAEIHAYAGLEDHTAQNTKGGSDYCGSYIDNQDLAADTPHLLDIGSTGDAHDQRCKNKGDDGHLDQIQISITDNVQYGIDDDIITDIAVRDKAQDRAQCQAKNHTDNRSLSQGSGFFTFEGCHSDSFFLLEWSFRVTRLLIFGTYALLFLCDLLLLIRFLS